jgi:zinc protease
MHALAPVHTAARATQFMLSNGMQVVVIPDHRAPVVTHMVWYRVGAADSPSGVSGIAHFLEHLMFKSTEKIPDGAFARNVLQLGGQLNAFTSQDVTAYHERISKDHLRAMMEMEADRMVNLRLTDEEVATERQVIIEERRSRMDSNPGARLNEQMAAALYISHPYGVPVIGWAHEMAELSREDALAFYKRYYAPNNAILAVSGDVAPDEVKRLAEETYGKILANPDVELRVRAQEPPHIAARRVTLKDPQAGSASFHRYYFVPSYATAKPGEAEALQVLMNIFGDGSTGRLYRKLVVEDKVAATAGGGYSGSGLDSGTISLSAVASDGDLDKVERAVDQVLDEVRKNGVTQLELERAKKSLRADHIYQSDEQEKLANRYGWALASGRTIEHVDRWPAAVAKVAADDVKAVANTYLDARRSVTGWLLPEPEAAHSMSHNGQSAKARTP